VVREAQPLNEKKEIQKLKVSKKLAEQIDQMTKNAVTASFVWWMARIFGFIEVEEENKKGENID